MGAAGIIYGTALQMGAANKLEAAKVRSDQQNQAMANAQAADALARGSMAAGAFRMRAGRIQGAQRAAYAASGVDTNTGSAAAVQAGTAAQGELDALMAKNNAARQAWGYQQTAAQYREHVQVDQDEASYQREEAMLGAGMQFENMATQGISMGLK